MRLRRTVVTRLVVGLAALLVVAAGAGLAEARTDDRHKPVIFIHGSDWVAPYGVSCAASFGLMKQRFRDFGHTGALVAVGYYGHDYNCDATIGHHGSHARHYASGHDSANGHTGNADIRHLAYHLAWFLYDHYSRAGVPVDVVGHSMGPLLIQYALAQTERHHPAFPPRLLVEDVVSLAGPFAGAKSIINTCHTRECNQMRPGSATLAWLHDFAWEPDGEGGTDWTAISSVDDNYVSAASGVAMGACHRVMYLDSSNVEHGDLLHDTSGSTRADVRRSDCPGTWVTDYSWYWPVRATDVAVAWGSH